MIDTSKINAFIDSLDIAVEGTYRGNCPQCGGKNTFTVTNDSGNMLYNCYKHGCRTAGAVHRNMSAFDIKTRLSNIGEGTDKEFASVLDQAFELPPFIRPQIPDEDKVNIFMRTWSIDPADVMYDIRQDRVVFPVWHEGIIVDAVGRSVFNKQPKWLRYASSPIPYMHGGGDTFVIVEDAISAYNLGEQFQNVVGVALLGTQLTDFHKWFFNKYFRYNKVIVALDHDAFTKSLAIAKDLRPYIENVRGLKLTDDLKYMRSNDVKALKEMLNGSY